MRGTKGEPSGRVRYLSDDEESRLMEAIPDDTEGKRDLRWAEKTVPRAVSEAKIEDFRFHDLRHAFASRLAMEGVDLLTIKDLGGWKTLSMVQRYAHLSPGHRQTAIERLVTRQVEAQMARVSGAE